MRMPAILETAWSMITRRPILVGPEAVGGPFSPTVTAQVLLTRVKGLMGEFGREKLDSLDQSQIEQLENKFQDGRRILLERTGFTLSDLTKSESALKQFSQVIDLSLEDTKKITEYVPKSK